MAPPRTLVRYEQIRRTEPINTDPLDDGKLAKGRYFQADCLVTDIIGEFVYITGPAVAGIPQVTKVNIQVYGMYPSVGLIIEKSTTTRCMVMVFGEVEVLPATLVPGRPYFIGLSAMITNIPPAPAPGTFAAIQAIGTAIDTGRLLLNVHPQLFLHAG